MSIVGTTLNVNTKTTRVMNAQAAGSSDVNGSSVDMQNFEGVMFIATLGAITASAVTALKAQQSADDSTFNDLEGTSISIADTDDNKAVCLDVYKPSDRYVRPVVERATANAVIDSVVAIQYGRRKGVVADDSSTVAGSETHVSPDEGTA